MPSDLIRSAMAFSRLWFTRKLSSTNVMCSVWTVASSDRTRCGGIWLTDAAVELVNAAEVAPEGAASRRRDGRVGLVEQEEVLVAIGSVRSRRGRGRRPRSTRASERALRTNPPSLSRHTRLGTASRPRRSATARTRSLNMISAFADGDGIHLGHEEILRQERGVVPAHDREDLRGEGLDLLQYVLRGVDLRGQGGDRHHLRLEASQRGVKVAVQPHVEDAKIVLRNRRGRPSPGAAAPAEAAIRNPIPPGTSG